MSHFTKVATKIQNIQLLMKALERLNKKFTYGEQGVEVRGYKGQKLTAELSINMGKYDIGLVKQQDGNYEMVADWWGIETTAMVTEQEVVEEINREYAYVCVVDACEAQGYQINEQDVERMEDGTVKLLAQKWG